MAHRVVFSVKAGGGGGGQGGREGGDGRGDIMRMKNLGGIKYGGRSSSQFIVVIGGMQNGSSKIVVLLFNV